MGNWIKIVGGLVLGLVLAGGVHLGQTEAGESEEPGASEDKANATEPAFAGLAWRNIGPARGGRVSSVCGVVGDRRTYYMGACGGGVWKTTNAGHTWKNVTDGFVKTGSVGAVAVAPSDPNVIYIGMGEADPRGNFSHGDGVYRSTDAGRTWTHLGLADTQQIGRIVVHPTDPDTVYVAALGHIHGRNAERGIYGSTDGGKTWTARKQVNADTGAVDLAMDPHNPRILFAAFWQVRRKPWRMDSGGPGSGLWRSMDSGATWSQLKQGLPKTVLGRIGVSASLAKPGLVYAMVEAAEGGVFRSDDHGDTWRRVNEERKLRQRAWYYSRIQADPQDAETVYVLNVRFHKSVDGGKTYLPIRTPHVDNHGIWIDPVDNQRMIESNDGGANVTADGGRTWSRQDNQPTAQFYRVTTDTRFPYRVLGSQQDNSTLSIAHTSTARNAKDFHSVGGGESGYLAVRPDNPDIIFGGSYAGWLTRYDHKTRLSRPISPWPENCIGSGADVLTHRFQWTFPIVFSPQDPKVLYVGGEVLFRSDNGGAGWRVISPDLTTNNKDRQKSSGGLITQDNTTVEYHCTIFTIAPSPKQAGRIWVGTDDGRVHVTDDEGGHWDAVAPAALKDDTLVSLIEASPHDADTAYIAANRYRSDDQAPYVFRTTDRGQTWLPIVKGLPKNAFVRTVRADPERAGLLYVGTETGIHVSFDAGGTWASLQLKLPIVPITGMVVKGDDLVISTQGRAFWILSGLSRLRARGRGNPPKDTMSMLAPVPAYLGLRRSCRIHFHMPEALEGDATLAIEGPGGTKIRSYQLKLDAESTDAESADKARKRGERKPAGAPNKAEQIKVKPGWNLWHWDLRRASPTKVPGAVGWPGLRGGPRVFPGAYELVLTVNGEERRRPLTVRMDPRRTWTSADGEAAKTHVNAVYDQLDAVHRAVNSVRAIRSQVTATVARARKAGAAKAIKAAADQLKQSLQQIEDALIQRKNKSPQDPLNYPVRLNDKLTMLLNLTNSSPTPTQGMRQVLASLGKRVQVQLDALEHVRTELVPAFNRAVAEAAVPAVVLPDKDK